MFSVEVNITKLFMQRQTSTVSRFVRKDIVVERLLFSVKAEVVSGEESFNLLKVNLECFDINIMNCISYSFDGTANMSGQYQSLQERL